MSKMSKAGVAEGTGRGLVCLVGGSNISKALILPPLLLSTLSAQQLREMLPPRGAAEASVGSVTVSE